MVSFSAGATLAQLRAWLNQNRHTGVSCPVCGQFAKVYQRRINSGMARSLIAMYREGGTDFVHLPSVLSARSREEGKLRYWGLVEEQTDVRPDGGRAGYWRVTPAGELFVHDLGRVPEYAMVYNGECLGLTGVSIGIQDALGAAFNYTELMRL